MTSLFNICTATKTSIGTIWAISALTLSLGACTLDYDSARGNGSEGGCAPEECGTNGIILADRRFSPVRLDGADNGHGVVYTGAVDRLGNELELTVRGGRFVPRRLDGYGPVLAADDLRGMQLQVTRANERGGTRSWLLTIHAQTSVPYMSDESGAVPAYRMTYAPADEPENQHALCAGDSATVLVVGEQYDALSLDIEPGTGVGLVELACQDHLLGKAMRMSYDPGRDRGDRYHTTIEQRRATLRMLAADYCGTGRRFTEQGTELAWRNRGDWMVIGGSPTWDARLEAAWDQSGAVCLGTPRRPDDYLRSDIEQACGRELPTCTPALLAASEWVTWVP